MLDHKNEVIQRFRKEHKNENKQAISKMKEYDYE